MPAGLATDEYLPRFLPAAFLWTLRSEKTAHLTGYAPLSVADRRACSTRQGGGYEI